MPVGQRTPGGLDHLERARDPGAIARFQTFGRRRIALPELGMQRLDAVALEPRAHAFAYRRRNRRHRRQPPRQRLEIEPGAAHENRQAVLRPRLSQYRRGIGHPVPRGEIHRGVDMAIEAVRNLCLFLRRRPRRDHPQVAIHLHGIGIDDDAAGFLRQLERQRRLAAGGRPCDKHGLAQTSLAQTLRIRLHVPRRHAHLQSRQPRAR